MKRVVDAAAARPYTWKAMQMDTAMIDGRVRAGVSAVLLPGLRGLFLILL